MARGGREASSDWVRATYDDVDWSKVTSATIVPFLDDGRVVIPENGLPADEIHDGEDVILDSVLRIPMEHCGFRRQGTHVFAITENGTHVAIWIDGDRYDGDRTPHRAGVAYWTGPASEVDDPLVAMADDARRTLSPDEFVADFRRILDPSYLNADTPQGGSGFGGTAEEWRDARSMVVDAIDRDGTYLDVGCANGHLMESVVAWSAEKGVHVEPYGVDISPDLVEYARRRLPHWSDRIWVGDALTWTPPRTFDIVHTLLDCVPAARRGDMVANVIRAVAPGGRLLLSQYGSSISARSIVEGLGFVVAGETGQPTRNGRDRGSPSVWLRQPE